jgi:hypothetical protein
MAELKRLAVATVVPGHGPVSHEWPAVMDAQADYLNGLLRDTRAAIRNGWTIQQAIDGIGVPTEPNWLLTDLFHRRNVTAAYAELEWEDDEPAVQRTTAVPGRNPSPQPSAQGGEGEGSAASKGALPSRP